ncbi:MAG: flavin reductase family protein [Pseudomonadota bacterium]
MFYKADEHHGLAHDPFKAIVAPRPIGWISTLDSEGRPNLAPYSFFNAVSDMPKIIMFASAGMKDSAANARDTGEFTFNFVSRALQDAMNVSSAGFPYDVNEFERAGVGMVGGETVSCPRVAGTPAALECKTLDIINPTTLSGEKAAYHIVLGQVTGVYLDDSMVTDTGRFDVMKADPIMRAGYRDYVTLDSLFELGRPGE